MQHDWRDEAPCRGQLPLFYPDIDGLIPETVWAAPRKICNECPHQNPCLELALQYETPDVKRFGMWGGMTPSERSRHVWGGTRT